MSADHLSSVPSLGYPRPQMQRDSWIDLNGAWDFAIDSQAEYRRPSEVAFDKTIVVPFAPETPASGIDDQGYYLAVWYRRTVAAPRLQDGQRLLLHFGAVDHRATVWVNDVRVVDHEGGYTPFVADVTDQAAVAGRLTIVVRAYDDPHDMGKPRGKQDWQPRPHSIWYPRTTGIWQSVWMEIVPRVRIESVRWTPDLERWEIGLDVRLAGALPSGLSLRIILTAGDQTESDDTCRLSSSTLRRQISLTDPGIGNARGRLHWSPQSPRLIDAELTLLDADGGVIDRVVSYTAMRGVAVGGAHFLLNGHPFKPMMLLDQGYWAQTGLTAPSDDAYRRDVELVKAMGFNGVRKHQKIENPRFLYWADKLGLMVWEEMPSPYRFTPETVGLLSREWTAAIERDFSHPCIVAWVPFNESWGVPDLVRSPVQRSFVQAIYHLTKTLDPTRPVIGNDGWEAATTDIVGIHDYEADPRRLVGRYENSPPNIDRVLTHERPGGHLLMLPDFTYQGGPIMLTEFGGIALHRDTAHTWGYSRAATPDELAARYAFLLAGVRATSLFSGFCYTQFTDTYQEANGLLYMDRTPKFPIEQIAVATRGARTAEESQLQSAWRLLIQERLREIEGGSLDALLRG